MQVGVQQVSPLSPISFALEIDRLTDEVRQESPSTIMIVDVIVSVVRLNPKWNSVVTWSRDSLEQCRESLGACASRLEQVEGNVNSDV